MVIEAFVSSIPSVVVQQKLENILRIFSLGHYVHVVAARCMLVGPLARGTRIIARPGAVRMGLLGASQQCDCVAVTRMYEGTPDLEIDASAFARPQPRLPVL